MLSLPKYGALGETRTHNLLLRRELLYPIELQAPKYLYFNKALLTPRLLAFGLLCSTFRNSKLKFLSTFGAATTPPDQVVNYSRAWTSFQNFIYSLVGNEN